MPRSQDDHPLSAVRAGRFMTTQWTVVLAAGRNSTDQSRQALATLCRAYWYPLYAFVRRSGHSPVEAEDLTQAFFAQLLEKNYVAAADRARGKFRSYLLAAVKHFLANQRDFARARKRGGGKALIPLHRAAAESRYRLEPSHELTAEKLYQQQWVLALPDRVLGSVREEYVAAGNEALFSELKVCLASGSQRANYRELAYRCGMTEGAVKVAVHRLRRRYRDRLRKEIATTVARPQDVDDEIRDLFGVFAS